MYKTERELVCRFVRRLSKPRNPWGTVRVSREFFYQRGRADVLALTDDGDHLIAFEAKLTKWRQALHQAYRNRCFAQSSYVLLPRAIAMAAERWSEEFRRRNVGLCYIEGARIVVVLAPDKLAPLEPWLWNQASEAVRKNRDARRRTRSRRTQNLQRSKVAV